MSSPWLPSPTDHFTVDVSRVGDRLGDSVTVTLAGELDLATGPALAAAVAAFDADNDRCQQLVVDMRDLTFIDAAGLRAILEIGIGRTTRYVNLAPAARRLFDLAGVPTEA